MTERRPGLESRPLIAAIFAAVILLLRRLSSEFQHTAAYRISLRGPSPTGVRVQPRDYRPADLDGARRLLLGRLELAGDTMEIGQGGDPWDTASPSRRFAVELHRFAWLPGLLALDPATYPAALAEALRLTLDWVRLFSRPSAFSWSAEVIERRVVRLACAAPRLVDQASELERRRLLDGLAEQARHLLRLRGGPVRAAERAAAVALAGAVLAGPAGQRLLTKGLSRLAKALERSVLADGGLRSRSPEQGLELLFDLLTLDDALHQRGVQAPEPLGRSIDRLTSAVSFFTLGDGRLGAFQGGESSTVRRVAAAVVHEDPTSSVFRYAPHSGYHRLSGRRISALVDAAPAAEGPWSVGACAQPLSVEIACGADRMIVNTGWSPDSAAPQALRLCGGGSTVTVGEAAVGAPLKGFLAEALGPRLVGAPRKVEARRNENEQGAWLELRHDGWARPFGVIHERRIYLDFRGDELRGEDAFAPTEGARPRRALIPFTARFHLAPDVRVSLARDRRSALLRGPSNRGWWFRNDAEEVALEPSVYYEGGLGRRSLQIVLRSRIGLEGSGRVRWKLSPVDPAEPGPAP
jgi:uncharacterized heparinase superfamily protein